MVWRDEPLIGHVDCQIMGCQEVGAEDGYCYVGNDEFPFVLLSLDDEVYVDASVDLQGLTVGCGDDWPGVRLEDEFPWRFWDKIAACTRVDQEGIS